MSCDVAPRVCRSPRAFAILAELAVQSLIDLLEYDRQNAPMVTLQTLKGVASHQPFNLKYTAEFCQTHRQKCPFVHLEYV